MTNAGLNFEVIPATCEENLDKSSYRDCPWKYAEDTAELKACNVVSRLKDMRDGNNEKPTIVIGADTVVTHDNIIYEKPQKQQDAHNMLTILSGKTHKVFSGVCLIKGDRRAIFHRETSVTFDQLSDEVTLPSPTSFIPSGMTGNLLMSFQVIRGYIATGEPMDKAGGYGIQALGSTLVADIKGDYFNVMGFPVNKFCKELSTFLR